MDDDHRADRLLDQAYEVISYRFRIRTDLAEVAPIVSELLSAFETEHEASVVYSLLLEGEGENPFVVRAEQGELFRTASALGLIDETLWHMNREAIAGCAPFLAIHSAAAERDGIATLLPATQDAGKSTLVAGLVRSGFRYLTDEAALIDGTTAEIEPYPKPMWLSPHSMLAIPGLQARVMPAYRELHRMRTYVRPVDLDGAVGVRSPVRLVVSPRYAPAHPAELVPMSRAETLMCLAENSFNLRERGDLGMAALRSVVDRAAGYRLTFSRLEEAVEIIGGLAAEVAA
jgi:hypothetical protein